MIVKNFDKWQPIPSCARWTRSKGSSGSPVTRPAALKREGAREAGIDLTPARDGTSPNQTIQEPSSNPERPLEVSASSLMSASERDSSGGDEQCSPVGEDGGQVCFGKPVPADKGPKAPASPAAPESEISDASPPWCDHYLTLVRATRTQVCDNRKVPAHYRKGGQVQATAWFLFQRLISLDGVNSFSETLSVKPISIPH
ncbi:hypothetical protein E3E14_07310 [Streptomyces sp. ICN441]|uniref:hypothetical protein n=1 Tax=Streptomyces sp. ICN441 TaxID=2558286 RepID=UPI00106C46A5|nr:hypothetical protein [Streptomyces sp. ICN441]TFE54542.1 hypothetical protein E3E14_07310 [Streptomyces sp. ICN441]